MYYSPNGSPGLNIGPGLTSMSRNEVGSFHKPTLCPPYIGGSGEKETKSLIKLPKINAITKNSIDDRTVMSMSPMFHESSNSSPGFRPLRNGSESLLKTTKVRNN